MTTLLVLECYEAAVVLAGNTRLVWVGFLVATIGCSLVLELGPIHGLALALIPMAAGIVLAMFAVVGRELEAARATSAGMVADLRGGPAAAPGLRRPGRRARRHRGALARWRASCRSRCRATLTSALEAGAAHAGVARRCRGRGGAARAPAGADAGGARPDAPHHHRAAAGRASPVPTLPRRRPPTRRPRASAGSISRPLGPGSHVSAQVAHQRSACGHPQDTSRARRATPPPGDDQP